MTIAKAFKNFVRALTGQTPVGNNIAEIINDGANKLATITGTDGFDLSELNTSLETLDASAVKYEDEGDKSFILNSSTTDSTKRFRISVIDGGTISATEIVAETVV